MIPLWKELSAGILIMILVVFTADVFFSFITPFTFDGQSNSGQIAGICLFIILMLLKSPLSFKINLTNLTYKKVYGFGPVKFGSWKPLPPVEYVSIFCQLLEDGGFNYHVNLWHEGNKHFTIHSDFFAEPAFKLAYTMATKLGVDLWDATDEDPDNYKWIKLDEAKIED